MAGEGGEIISTTLDWTFPGVPNLCPAMVLVRSPSHWQGRGGRGAKYLLFHLHEQNNLMVLKKILIYLFLEQKLD